MICPSIKFVALDDLKKNLVTCPSAGELQYNAPRMTLQARQQRETLSYFNAAARDWLRKAEGRGAQVNVIRQRNDFVLDWLASHPRARNLLDVGCGTGDLVLEAARRRVKGTGVDFAGGMIRIARRRAKSRGLAAADFVQGSIFDFDFGKHRYDVISANGFIEYISLRELDRFLRLVRSGLAPGGAIILGSRNRLFNLFSLNRFTEAELSAGAVRSLLAESISLANTKTLRGLARITPTPLSRPSRQPRTGIPVSTRYQYTPVQLIRLLERHGFSPARLAPVHIHAAPPRFKERRPALHARLSEFLHPFGAAHPELLPMASSFMIAAVRK